VDMYPRQLLLERPPKRYEIKLSAVDPELGKEALHVPVEFILLREFLRGESDCLKRWLEGRLHADGPSVQQVGSRVFQQQMVASDLDLLQIFYDLGPRRNKALRDHHGLHANLILQEQLDDLLVSDVWRTVRPLLYPPVAKEVVGEPPS